MEEEAAFWDTHDVTNLVGQELQPVEITNGAELAEHLTVWLNHAHRAALARRAREKGVGWRTLARMWLMERLRNPKRGGAPLPESWFGLPNHVCSAGSRMAFNSRLATSGCPELFSRPAA